MVKSRWSMRGFWTEKITREIRVVRCMHPYSVEDLLFHVHLLLHPSSSSSRHYNLTVQATDNGSPNMSTTAVIYITVMVSEGTLLAQEYWNLLSVSI